MGQRNIMKYLVKRKGNRFVISDEKDKVVDDAQGYGYKTFEKGRKALWYKFGGGKQKIDKDKGEAKRFFKQYPIVEKDIDDLFMTWFKELARGEVSGEEIIKEIEKKHNISIPRNYLKYR